MIRLTDILVSLIAIILLAPIFVLITVLCAFDTKSPFFLQKRIGRHERLFTILNPNNEIDCTVKTQSFD